MAKEPVLVPSFVSTLSESEKNDDLSYLRMMTGGIVDQAGDDEGETFFTNVGPLPVENIKVEAKIVEQGQAFGIQSIMQ
jgi:hypothetical protein